MRKLFHPLLKLFFNPDKITSALHIQAKVNTEYHRQLRQRDAMDPLFYEIIHNLVVETTRLGIEVQNLKMRVESLSSRMDFDERRARALEDVVEYQAGAAGTAAMPRGPERAGPPRIANGSRAHRVRAADREGDPTPPDRRQLSRLRPLRTPPCRRWRALRAPVNLQRPPPRTPACRDPADRVPTASGAGGVVGAGGARARRWRSGRRAPGPPPVRAPIGTSPTGWRRRWRRRRAGRGADDGAPDQ